MTSENQVIQQSRSMPTGVDSTGLVIDATDQKKPARNILNIKIQMLDNSITIFQIQHKAIGKVLFEQVCRMLNLLESDYFGLEYLDRNNTKYWLDYEKRMNRQIGLTLIDPVLYFRVKFYTPDPAQLEEPYTRYLFSLQIKYDMAEGILQCNDNTSALMSSYIIQSECGDYMEEDYPDHSHISSSKFVPHQDAEMERRIMEHYRKHKGQTPEVADLNLLEIARRCELYGIRMSRAKDHEGMPLFLAVAHMGILVFQNYTKINTFSWAKIRKLSFKKKRFLIKLHSESHAYYKDPVEFYFEGRNECKNFWKKCIEHHGFFRCSVVRTLPRQKTRVFSRGSSFRYSGKTQKEVVDYVRSNFMKRQPFQRSASFKMQRQSGREAHVTMGRSISTHLPISESEQNFAQHQNATSTPVSQSCGSVTLTDKSGDELSPSKELPLDTPFNQKRSSSLKKVDGHPPAGSVHVLPNLNKPLSYSDRFDHSSETLENTYHIPPPEGFSPDLPLKNIHPPDRVNVQRVKPKSPDSGRVDQKSPKPPTRKDSRPTSSVEVMPPAYKDVLQKTPTHHEEPNQSAVLRSHTPSSKLEDKIKQPVPPRRIDSKAINHSSSAFTKDGKSIRSATNDQEVRPKNKSKVPQTVSVSVNTDPLDFDATDVSFKITPTGTPQKTSSTVAANQGTKDVESEDSAYELYQQRVAEVCKKVQDPQGSPHRYSELSEVIAAAMSNSYVTETDQQDNDSLPQSPRKDLRPKSSPKITTVTIVKRKVEPARNADKAFVSPPVSVRSSSPIVAYNQNFDEDSFVSKEFTAEPKISSKDTVRTVDDMITKSEVAKPGDSEDLINMAHIDGELQYVLKKRFVALHSVERQESFDLDGIVPYSLAEPEKENNATKMTPSGQVKSKIPPPKPPRDTQRSGADSHKVTIQFNDPQKKLGCTFKAERLPQTGEKTALLEEKQSISSRENKRKGPSYQNETNIKSDSPITKPTTFKVKVGHVPKPTKVISPIEEEKLSIENVEIVKMASKKPSDLSLHPVRELHKRESPIKPKNDVELVYISERKDTDPSCEVILLPSKLKERSKVKPNPPPKPKKPTIPPKPAVSPKPAHLVKRTVQKKMEIKQQSSKRKDSSDDDSSITESSKATPKSPKTVKSPVLYSRWKPLTTPVDKEPNHDMILWSAPKSPKSNRSIDVVPLSLLPSTDSYSFKDDTISSKSPDSELLEKLMGSCGQMQVPPIPPFPRRKDTVSDFLREENAVREEKTQQSQKLPPPPPPHRVDYNPNIYIGHTFRALSRISEGSQSEQSHSDSSPPRDLCDFSSETSSDHSTSRSDQRISYCSSDTSGAMETICNEQIYVNSNLLDDYGSDSSNMDQFYLDINSEEREELERQGHKYSCNTSSETGSTLSSDGNDTLCGDDLSSCEDEVPYTGSTSQYGDRATHCSSIFLSISPTGAIIEDDRNQSMDH